jgi:hypothetical protein
MLEAMSHHQFTVKGHRRLGSPKIMKVPDIYHGCESESCNATSDAQIHLLTRPHLRARRRVRRRHRVVDVDQDSRVRRLVRARERNQRSRGSIATARNLDLRTADVKLRSARGPRRMQRNVLHAEEILSARQALRDRHSDLSLVLAGPAQSATRDRRALLVDLEPRVSAAVPGGGGLTAGDLGHVELESARVRDGALGGEAEGGSGRDFVGTLGRGSGGELIAADLVGCDLRGVSIRSPGGVGRRNKRGSSVRLSRVHCSGSLSSYGHTAMRRLPHLQQQVAGTCSGLGP